jgi:hypothetical protein
MYQIRLNFNPQQDLQGFRTGQTQKHAYLYRIMIDCYPEKHRLQKQVEKAGGWRQLKFNVDDACAMLGIPRSWLEDEPEDVDPVIPPYTPERDDDE